MIKEAMLAPPNSQTVISDPQAVVEVPRWKRDVAYVSTDTCILVGCLMDADGETTFVLGDMQEVDPRHPPLFEGRLKTPNRHLALETVDGRTVLEARVSRQEMLLRIWTNSEREPDKVIVGFE